MAWGNYFDPFIFAAAKAILSAMIEQLLALSWVDWVVTVTGIIYVILAAQENIWCWFWGFVSCSLWAYADFAFYQLYADGVLQIFYAAMSAWGYWQWKSQADGGEQLAISRMSIQEHVQLISLGVIGGVMAGYFLGAYTDAAATYPDAITTVFALLTTYLVIQKKIENWLYWICIDSIYIFIYQSRGAYLFVVIMLIYLVVAAYGWRNWQRKYHAQQRPNTDLVRN